MSDDPKTMTPEREAEIRGWVESKARKWHLGTGDLLNFVEEALAALDAERKAHEDLAQLAALREVLKMTADCLPMKHAQRDRALRVYFGGLADAAARYRARVRAEALREGADACEAESVHHPSEEQSYLACARLLAALAVRAEKEAGRER